MAIEFALPEFLRNGTDVETIHKRMLDELPGDIDATEGGFVWDFTRPAAVLASELLEFWIPETLKLLFTDTASGKYLDYLAERAQTSRKGATKAVAVLAFTGEPSAVVPSGTVVSTASIAGTPAVEFETLEECILDVSGTGSVKANAVEAGTGGNVDADTLVLFSAPVFRVATVTNPLPATGGTAVESDENLRERIEYINTHTDVSMVGSQADYKRWAEEVDGVGTAAVIPEWDGPQTVKIILTDANGDPCNETIRTAVYNHLMSPDEPLQRLTPPDMELTVSVPEMVDMGYIATVELKTGHSISDVEAAFTKALQSYYREAVEEGEIKYTRIGALLADAEGVNDYKLLKVNSGTSNIYFEPDEYPRTYSITFTEGEVT